ncbi:MAG: TlpA family protein disulfide reductase [Acidobacteriota bacterium]|nr:TlpA family protein disulfide reductase [Acidobacteriota bacterium]
MAEQQNKLLEKFDEDVSEGKAQLYDWESRADNLRLIAAERAAGFKVADWKDDELLALAALYQAADNFPATIEALRAYLKEDAKSRKALDVLFSLARALIEMERFHDAESVLTGMQFARFSFLDAPAVAAAKMALYKDLALAWRDLGQIELAAKLTKEGLVLAGPAISDRLNEPARRDQLSLVALFVALNERRGRKKEAEDFQKMFVAGNLKEQPQMLSFYESELAAARLTGRPAPELSVNRWLSDAPKPLAQYRGKVVLLDFWAMWCSACLGDFPHLTAFQKKFASKGFEIIGVTRFYGRSDKEEGLSREQEWKSLNDFRNRYKLDFPIAVGKIDDPTNDERYGIAGMPTLILIDRRGNVRHIKRDTGDYHKLEKRIEKLVNEN